MKAGSSLIRRTRQPGEVENIIKAQAITEKVFNEVFGIIKEGIEEREISTYIERRFKELGSPEHAFETIVAFGDHGAEPHAVPSERKLKKGDFVTIDMGATYNGLCSDMTRTFAFGNVSDEQKYVYNLVLEAQLKSIEFLAIGKRCEDADAVARNYFKEAGMDKYFIHTLGHGVGTVVHEGPRIGKGSEDVFILGDVVTSEPGLYLPGKFGVRIEDMLYLGENGVENLTNIDKQLIII